MPVVLSMLQQALFPRSLLINTELDINLVLSSSVLGYFLNPVIQRKSKSKWNPLTFGSAKLRPPPPMRKMRSMFIEHWALWENWWIEFKKTFLKLMKWNKLGRIRIHDEPYLETSYCGLRAIFILPHVEGLELWRVIDDKDWYVATVPHQVLLMFGL